jgi:hypothetical protein
VDYYCPYTNTELGVLCSYKDNSNPPDILYFHVFTDKRDAEREQKRKLDSGQLPTRKLEHVTAKSRIRLIRSKKNGIIYIRLNSNYILNYEINKGTD